MDYLSVEDPGRRNFLRAAPAAAGLALADARLFALAAQAPNPWPGAAAQFKLFAAAAIAQDLAATQAAPGTIDLVNGKDLPFTMVLTTERRKSATEFEWHQNRDHIFQVLDGWTIYEVGGTPKGGHFIAPGEWRGKDAAGATRLTLHKGDRLVIPRGTPHRRGTPEMVTFTLISPQGAMKA